MYSFKGVFLHFESHNSMLYYVKKLILYLFVTLLSYKLENQNILHMKQLIKFYDFLSSMETKTVHGVY